MQFLFGFLKIFKDLELFGISYEEIFHIIYIFTLLFLCRYEYITQNVLFVVDKAIIVFK